MNYRGCELMKSQLYKSSNILERNLFEREKKKKCSLLKSNCNLVMSILKQCNQISSS